MTPPDIKPWFSSKAGIANLCTTVGTLITVLALVCYGVWWLAKLDSWRETQDRHAATVMRRLDSMDSNLAQIDRKLNISPASTSATPISGSVP